MRVFLKSAVGRRPTEQVKLTLGHPGDQVTLLGHALAWDEDFQIRVVYNERGRPKADRASRTYAWASRGPGNIIRAFGLG